MHHDTHFSSFSSGHKKLWCHGSQDYRQGRVWSDDHSGKDRKKLVKPKILTNQLVTGTGEWRSYWYWLSCSCWWQWKGILGEDQFDDYHKVDYCIEFICRVVAMYRILLLLGYQPPHILTKNFTTSPLTWLYGGTSFELQNKVFKCL